MSELVKRLRAHIPPDAKFGSTCLEDDLLEAASRIEALEAENARLRLALEESERLSNNLNVQNVLLMQKDHP